MQTFIVAEAARQIPVIEETDVLVAGAGPAGSCAAIAAARTGAKVRLIESGGCLGGTWTRGLLSWLLDFEGKTGLPAEILRRLDLRNARRIKAYEAEQMKLLLDEMCAEAGVAVRLHTNVVAAHVAAGRVEAAITESKAGREAWRAKAFIDCTGDGDLAARAGCAFDLGDPAGRCQPLSLICLLAGVSSAELVEAGFVRADAAGGQTKKRLLQEMERAGVSPSYRSPTLFAIRDGLVSMMANHEYGVRADDPQAISVATARAREEIHRMVDALRGLGGVWKDVHIVASAEHIGVREGRRIRGLYRVTQDDLRSGARHEDAVCRAAFGVDVHALDATGNRGIEAPAVAATQPYDIPLRSLIAADVGGLMMAGRCISGDFIAHSSYRVTGDVAALGQAAGITAALAALHNLQPRDVPWAQVKARLKA